MILNAFHVVVAQNCSSATILDGFTILGGNADVYIPMPGSSQPARRSNPVFSLELTARNKPHLPSKGDKKTKVERPKHPSLAPVAQGAPYSVDISFSEYGGGLLSLDSDLKLANCSFIGNQASDGGAAAFLGLVNDHPSVENCTVSLNGAEDEGGGIYDDEANLSISSTQFTGNGALYAGGGYYREGAAGGMTFSSAVLSYCTFTGNVAAVEGGGAYNSGNETNDTAIDHCVFIVY